MAERSIKLDTELTRECLKRAKRLAGNKAITGTLLNRILCRTIGLERKEKLAQTLARIGIANYARRNTGLTDILHNRIK